MSDICVINSKVFDLLPQTARLGKKVFHPGKEESWQKKWEKEPRRFPYVQKPCMPAIFICTWCEKSVLMVLDEEEVGFESDDKLPLNCPFVKVMRASKSIAENFLPNPLFLKR